MELMDKLTILADSAKYDVACTSSGVSRTGNGQLGSCLPAGCCHAFSADGRCVSLLKVLLTNVCAFDCSYCVNRRSNDIPRAAFTPRELAELTIQFYRRNYIEGLFLSSAVLKNPDYTMEQMISALELLRGEYGFRGYIHAKTIPGADPALIQRMGLLADRLSVNIELPSEASLGLLAPDKARTSIFRPMRQIARTARENTRELAVYKHTPRFAPAGQSTQMIVGASPENDRHILRLTEGLYQKYSLKRVFFSAYIPVSADSRLPALSTPPPLLREHRLYQADWLLRFYHFSASEILSDDQPDLDPYLDPKCGWAVRNPGYFPVDVNRAEPEQLLRVPGIGPKSARRIVIARRTGALDLDALRRIGVVLKRAQYFIVCRGYTGARAQRGTVARALLDPAAFSSGTEQLSLFSAPAVQQLTAAGTPALLASKTVWEEAAECLSRRM
ncbi:putative DNA modification/repair radical SAM protein [Anaerofilum sp. An201]|nr:putative DNA modification/repair radical SAM protein [Anaerofilum sp. An201]OUP05123.1 putative DNA modification/repair radical SAM protein [Anaerofilum sp. An201]